jgi:hypothetical protein
VTLSEGKVVAVAGGLTQPEAVLAPGGSVHGGESSLSLPVCRRLALRTGALRINGQLQSVIAMITALAAAAAVLVAVWQARRTVTIARQTNAGPAVTTQISQFSDSEFRKAMDGLRSLRASGLIPGPFSTLRAPTIDQAYRVCYFFEYLGILVAFGHIDSEIVIGTMSTQLVEMWTVMRPWIACERIARRNGDPLGRPDFLPYFENLVVLIVKGRSRRPLRPRRTGVQAVDIRARLNVRRFAVGDALAAVPPVPGDVEGQGQVAA